jgi:translation initiation factor 2 subunit 2
MDYEKMLDRGMEETPDIVGGSDRFDVPEPDIRQEGHSTVFENFQSVVDKLDRRESHLLKFLQNDLGTSANIDESDRARLTGEFDTDRMAEAVEAYIEQYVLCSECGLPDTNLEREQGAEILQCDACGAQSST